MLVGQPVLKKMLELDIFATDAKGNRRTLTNLAALCLEDAARRNDKVVTGEIVSDITIQCQL